MNKKELIQKVSKESNKTQNDVSEILESLGKVIKEEVKKGEEVKVVGFGKFSLAHRKERTARDIRTGEPVKVPARDVAKFKASKNFLD